MDKVSLIYKVLSGTVSETERKELDDWIKQCDANKSEYYDIKLLYENTLDEVEQKPDDHFYDGFHTIKHKIRTRIRRRRTKHLVGGVLISLFLFMMVLFIFQITTGEKKNILLKFDNVPLEYVINTIQDHYPISIEAGNEIMNCKFTGTFYRDNADDIVRSIALCLNLKYTTNGNRKFRIEGTCIQRL